MANHQFRQPPQRGPPPDQGHYGQQNTREGHQQPISGRVAYGGGGGYHEPNARPYQDPYVGQNGVYQDQQHTEEQYWDDQQYQQSYQEPSYGNGSGNGHHSGQQYERRPPPQSSRSYQYDERFHNQGGGRGYGPDRARRSEDRHRPAHLSLERRPKPRERILTAPTSPKEIAWDNPFPTFGPTKKKDKKKHTSLDKGIGKLDIGGGAYPSDARPQTSQSSRRREGSRPNTSHGQHAPLPEFLDSPNLQQHPMSPLRRDNPKRRPVPLTEGTYDGDDPTQRYRHTGVNPSQPPASFRGQAGQPPRSMTAPSTPITADYQATTRQLPGRGDPYQDPPASSSYTGATNEYSDPNYNYQRQGHQQANSSANTARPHPDALNLQTSGQGFLEDQTDMPNFDAIPKSASEKEDALLQDNRGEAVEQPAYQKKSYQAMPSTGPSNGYPPAQEQPGQFPQRGASRPEPVNQRSQQGKPDRGQPYDQDYNTNQYDQGYEYEQPAANQGGGYRGIQQYPPSTGEIQRQYSRSPPRPGGYNGMQSMAAARPPPVRHYGDRNSSDSYQRQHGRQSSFGNPSSPDALPAHPVPFRPGLLNKNEFPRAETPQAQAAPTQRRPQPPAAAPAKPPAEPPVTREELNTLEQRVKNIPQDFPTALKLAKRLVQAAKTLANEGGRADAKTTAKNRERFIFDAHKIVKRLVSQGYPDAMFYLADCHGQGLLGLAPDPKEAFQLYQSAAKLGHPQSAYRVAVCCEIGAEDGGGTRRDPLKAIQWYKRAATLGDTPAMYKMGMILLKGLLGQPKNPRDALSWLKRAAERANEDNPHALHELGLLYESARPEDHIIKDQTYALQLFTQAAELNYKYSQFRLGVIFEYGLLVVAIDPRQSIAWYSKAAAQGEHQSELALSGWYLTGSEGVLKQNDTEAFLWARKAASAGLAKAEFAMGYYTEVGIGGASNLDEAKRWYWKAAAQEDPRARKRLEEMKQGGGRMKKERVSRSAVNRGEGECVVM